MLSGSLMAAACLTCRTALSSATWPSARGTRYVPIPLGSQPVRAAKERYLAADLPLTRAASLTAVLGPHDDWLGATLPSRPCCCCPLSERGKYGGRDTSLVHAGFPWLTLLWPCDGSLPHPPLTCTLLGSLPPSIPLVPGRVGQLVRMAVAANSHAASGRWVGRKSTTGHHGMCCLSRRGREAPSQRTRTAAW